VLKTELREFQVQLYGSDTPEVHIRLNVKLVKMPLREIVATNRFSSKAKAGGAKLDKIIAAFDESLGRVLKKTVVWTIREIHRRGGGRRARRR
jgi:cholesterol transport system auxiliary component